MLPIKKVAPEILNTMIGKKLIIANNTNFGLEFIIGELRNITFNPSKLKRNLELDDYAFCVSPKGLYAVIPFVCLSDNSVIYELPHYIEDEFANYIRDNKNIHHELMAILELKPVKTYGCELEKQLEIKISFVSEIFCSLALFKQKL